MKKPKISLTEAPDFPSTYSPQEQNLWAQHARPVGAAVVRNEVVSNQEWWVAPEEVKARDARANEQAEVAMGAIADTRAVAKTEAEVRSRVALARFLENPNNPRYEQDYLEASDAWSQEVEAHEQTPAGQSSRTAPDFYEPEHWGGDTSPRNPESAPTGPPQYEQMPPAPDAASFLKAYLGDEMQYPPIR